MSDIKAETKNDNSVDDVSKVSVRKFVKIVRQAEFPCQGGVYWPQIRGDARSLENSEIHC